MDTRKGQLKELLRAARARVDPTEVGLGDALRRKSPGLRREDVAVLAGVSFKWYTWLEQGRDVNFSQDVLDRVSTALRLTSPERRYFLALMDKRSPHVRDDRISQTLWRIVHHVPIPALVITRRWDLVAWNTRVTRVFRDYGAVPPAERNLLRIILTDEKYQSDGQAFDLISRKLLGEFRVDYGTYADDPTFVALVKDLMEVVPDFECRWKEVEVCEAKGGTLVQHDELGELSFDRVSYVPEDRQFLRVLMFVPRDARTARIIASMGPDVPPARANDAPFEPYVFRHTNRH